MRVFIVDDSAVIVERLADLLKDIPGVVLAGHAGDAPEAVRCLGAGANFFLDKSAEFEKIPAILREIAVNATKTAPVGR